MEIGEIHTSRNSGVTGQKIRLQNDCLETAPLELINCIDGVEWLISTKFVSYPFAEKFMEDRVEAIRANQAPEAVWLLEHSPLLTAGTSARPEELLNAGAFPVYHCGRGGRYTYHGPGQRVAYVMLDLRKRGSDVRAFVCALENWLISTLAELGIQGERRADRIGVWVVDENGHEAKIAALGIRVRRWISYHGIALNLAPDLDHFNSIVPCGLAGYPVTSLRKLGRTTTMDDLDQILMRNFAATVGALKTCK